MYRIFSREKSFIHPWVGNPTLNKLGLHALRMKCAKSFNNFRYNRSKQTSGYAEKIRRDGCIAIGNFLTQQEFISLYQEVCTHIDTITQAHPFPTNSLTGFQEKTEHEWGFDRFDGGTLNRLINIDAQLLPHTAIFTQNEVLNDLTRAITGKQIKTSKIWIYQTVHGDESKTPDLQKQLHRDTFFSSMKFWYFLEPVTLETGPFSYVIGSHQLTKDRLLWEWRKARNAALSKNGEKSGSFRITEQEFQELNYEKPRVFTVAENTLVMADTLGFHRRGHAKPGATRLALYGNSRPHPFDLTW
jgi:hypothetical protein